ncbi:protein YTP1 [Podospora aff. communis PSN243]|uniref:Protein YTP1 n=1 Tax=Podospora aff. communis PSN243 TaxID=3040156 RepID=A0AAV9GUU3_9PEZI|nr:protein YTP1 [Podospora aff. communis PSN243]
MKALAASFLTVVASAAVLGLVPTVLAHGDDMNMEKGEADKPLPEDQYPPTYFALADHRAAIYGHIGLMVLAWVFILPPAVMLSLARSRYTLAAQFAFATANGAGLLLGTVYNASTPDLYPNNAHHQLGWIVTWVVGTQGVIGLLARVAGVFSPKSGLAGRSHECQSFIPVSTEAMAEHESRFSRDYRFSNDSGQGTERRTESLRSHSSSSGTESPAIPMRDVPLRKEYEVPHDDDDGDFETHIPKALGSGAAGSALRKAAGMISSKVWRGFMFAYNFVDRSILMLGFIAICTGVITYGRFFEGHGIFSGLAHWIKGGIFFWLGLFTLGRWAGSFGELGWAWNVRPKQAGQKWRPSAEFVESFLIFFYGSTNIFLEHLGNWGGEYSAQDLEHISITVLFIGGGLFGMLVESVRIRDLLNVTVAEAVQTTPELAYRDEEREELRAPETYPFSMNPIPALVILLLGIMMSSHTQESMISSMVHKQWGQLLTGASFARGLTYVLTYLKPPKSVYPSRPPTEILTAFGLLSGGIIFMASASDTIDGMIHYELDAMFMYTVTMGLVGLLMAWVIMVVAIKGWAVRKERARE